MAPTSRSPSGTRPLDARATAACRGFRLAYAEHRAAEGRAWSDAETLALPYVRTGQFAREWKVRARTFKRFRGAALNPVARQVAPRPVRVLDLGAGNGWLCHQVHRGGGWAVALDLRTDRVDGLGAAAHYRRHLDVMFTRVAASFQAIPLADRTFDIAVFNASLHYALDLAASLGEAARVLRAGGRIAILDSPFYLHAEAGEAMVAEKRKNARRLFGERADELMAFPFVEYLTRERLERASTGLGLTWKRHRVRYPLWYELRPLWALLKRRRPPSRFDMWEATVP